jgi:hypothetical protein
MERHHEAQLHQALDQLYIEGVTCIRWDQIYLWFNADRLSKGAYRELIRRWEELCTTYGHDNAPTLEVFHYSGKPTLTLLRTPFDKEEKREALSNWV